MTARYRQSTGCPAGGRANFSTPSPTCRYGSVGHIDLTASTQHSLLHLTDRAAVVSQLSSLPRLPPDSPNLRHGRLYHYALPGPVRGPGAGYRDTRPVVRDKVGSDKTEKPKALLYR